MAEYGRVFGLEWMMGWGKVLILRQAPEDQGGHYPSGYEKLQ